MADFYNRRWRKDDHPYSSLPLLPIKNIHTFNCSLYLRWRPRIFEYSICNYESVTYEIYPWMDFFLNVNSALQFIWEFGFVNFKHKIYFNKHHSSVSNATTKQVSQYPTTWSIIVNNYNSTNGEWRSVWYIDLQS